MSTRPEPLKRRLALLSECPSYAGPTLRLGSVSRRFLTVTNCCVLRTINHLRARAARSRQIGRRPTIDLSASFAQQPIKTRKTGKKVCLRGA
jgi:hypothetical protein